MYLGGYNFTVETDDEGSYYKIDCSGRRFKQTADIDMAGRSWEPIAKDDSMRYFRTLGRTAEHTYYFAEQGEEITLGYDNVPAGYKAVYHSDDVTITDGVFTMPDKDVSVTSDIVIDPAHFSQDDENTYTIHTAEGWELFCACLKNTGEYNRFSGKTVKLGADITVSTMAGSDSCDFCGTFDGDRHTLTFNYGKSESYAEVEYIAPFCYVSTVTPAGGEEIPAKIENLHVDGDIYTSKKYAAGLVAQHWGTLTIENCRSSVNIHSSVSGDAATAVLKP